MLGFFFPKKCAGCSKNLESRESSICALCSTHFQIAIRHDCSVCSRDLSSCLLCQNSCSPKILATFEPSATVKRLLKKSYLLSGWHLHESLANAMWLKFLTRESPLFDEVLPISEPFWGSWKSSQVNKYLAKFFLKKLKIKSQDDLKNALSINFKRVLVVGILVSEKDVQQIMKRLSKEKNIQVTFLIGCWNDDLI